MFFFIHNTRLLFYSPTFNLSVPLQLSSCIPFSDQRQNGREGFLFFSITRACIFFLLILKDRSDNRFCQHANGSPHTHRNPLAILFFCHGLFNDGQNETGRQKEMNGQTFIGCHPYFWRSNVSSQLFWRWLNANIFFSPLFYPSCHIATLFIHAIPISHT